ncbi:hypothetical protein JOC77_001840 [Peribacillus deserti]|uniref:Peptidyl-prolyl cis-trans isomerase n=1 Tax=Peribacillus deserti TaxID=673318 RepID=A0ABS2QHH7_9BACI|nr:peptidyl-prolyl cis-trans isomerase [Peribacillus deserti]MBM7692410.1 hypothetical protein [Peribacillus deserti]
MESILMIQGRVKYPITLDPGVWIFDDRKIDMDVFFSSNPGKPVNEIEEYTKKASKHWDREIMEGAVHPPTLKSEKKFEKEKILTGTFGIPLLPFLKNAEPESGASIINIEAKEETIRLNLSDASELILGFSQVGKPLKEGGPVYVYYKDGSNYTNPIKSVSGFRIE